MYYKNSKAKIKRTPHESDTSILIIDTWAAFFIGPMIERNYPLVTSRIATSMLSLGFEREISVAGLLASTIILRSYISAWMRGEIRWRSAPWDAFAVAFAGDYRWIWERLLHRVVLSVR
jgi:hypothetical protein